MTYFDCFMAVSWSFAIGWGAAAIYMQNQNEQKTEPTQGPKAVENPLSTEKLERYNDSEVWRVASIGSASAAD